MVDQQNDNETQKQAIIQAYAEGESLNRVGIRFGLSSETVRKIVTQAGIIRSYTKKQYVKKKGELTSEKRQAIIEAYQLGRSTLAIGKAFDLCQATVSSVLKASGKLVVRKHLTDEDINTIIESYKAGKTTYEIEKEIGFSNVTVAKILRNLGIQKRSIYRLSREQQAQIVIDYNNGESSESIAKRLGVSANCALETLKRNGVKIRPLWPQKEKPLGQLFDPNFDPQELPDCRFGGIYKFTNLINGKVYIGQSANIYKRYYQHREMRASGLFTKALKKYGIGNFSLEVLERVDDASRLNEREQYWMDFYQCYDRDKGYNIAEIAGTVQGVKRPDVSERLKRRFRFGASNPMFGKKHSKESKEKIRQRAIERQNQNGNK